MMEVLLIIVAIIVIIIVVKVLVYSNKKKKSIEELKNSKVYEVAEKIREELEKIGFNKDGFEPHMCMCHDAAYGSIGSFHPERKERVIITFSCYWDVLYDARSFWSNWKAMHGKCVYGIENDNIGGMLVIIKSEKNEFFEDAPEPIKIAAEVIKNNGFGSCIEFKKLRHQKG